MLLDSLNQKGRLREWIQYIPGYRSHLHERTDPHRQ